MLAKTASFAQSVNKSRKPGCASLAIVKSPKHGSEVRFGIRIMETDEFIEAWQFSKGRGGSEPKHLRTLPNSLERF